MPFIVLQVGGEQALVTYQEFINDRNAGNPVSVFYFSLSLNVILTSFIFVFAPPTAVLFIVIYSYISEIPFNALSFLYSRKTEAKNRTDSPSF